MKMIKKLYTTFTVEGSYDEIKKNPELTLMSYSGGKGECIKYHDTLEEFVECVISNIYNHAGGFGLKMISKGGIPLNTNYYSLEFNKYQANSYPLSKTIKNLYNIIDAYENVYDEYWEIPRDNIYLYSELTGHIYYRSPIESCDSCGTCDGARCDFCKRVYVVEDFSNAEILYRGKDEEEAKKVFNDSSYDYSDIISSILQYYNLDHNWFDVYVKENAKQDTKYEPLRLLIEYTKCATLSL